MSLSSPVATRYRWWQMTWESDPSDRMLLQRGPRFSASSDPIFRYKASEAGSGSVRRESEPAAQDALTKSRLVILPASGRSATDGGRSLQSESVDCLPDPATFTDSNKWEDAFIVVFAESQQRTIVARSFRSYARRNPAERRKKTEHRNRRRARCLPFPFPKPEPKEEPSFAKQSTGESIVYCDGRKTAVNSLKIEENWH